MSRITTRNVEFNQQDQGNLFWFQTERKKRQYRSSSLLESKVRKFCKALQFDSLYSVEAQLLKAWTCMGVLLPIPDYLSLLLLAPFQPVTMVHIRN